MTWEKVMGEGGPDKHPHVQVERSTSEQITRTRVLGDISETKIRGFRKGAHRRHYLQF
jgi:hypothetical protein